MTCHVRMIEARICLASVGVSTGRAVSAVSSIAGTAVQAWSIVIAGSVVVAVVQLVGFAIHYHGAGATSLCVSGAACACIRVGSRIAA